MKILCFQPYAALEQHTAAFCELMQALAAEGHELYLLTCERTVHRCFQNAWAKPELCDRCVGFQRSMEAWLVAHGVPYRKIRAADFLPEPGRPAAFRRQHAGWRTEAELRAIYYKDFDVGRSALGSLITEIRDADPPLEPNRALIDDYIENGVLYYDAAAAVFARFGIDKACIFNGRLPEVRGCLLAAQAAGKPWCMVEVGVHHTRYSLFENAGPHDIAFHSRQLADWRRRLAAGEVEPERVEQAEHWFLRRQGGALIDGKPMLQHQRSGQLPPEFHERPRRITFYLGSRDEYVCLPDWALKLFASQEDAIRQIAARYRDDASVQFFVRVHPYLTGLDNHQTREIAALKSLPNVTVIAPDSPVSTYALATQSDLNVTFGSTVGIESLYLGRFTLSLGPAVYQDQPGILMPSTREQAFAEIDRFLGAGRTMTPHEKAQARLSALAYGLYYTQSGVPYRHFQVSERFDVRAIGGPAWGRRPYQEGALRAVQRFLRNPFAELARRRLLRQAAARRLGGAPTDRLP